jgi:hypothetical protein
MTFIETSLKICPSLLIDYADIPFIRLSHPSTPKPQALGVNPYKHFNIMVIMRQACNLYLIYPFAMR